MNRLFFLVIFLGFVSSVFGQQKNADDLIASSQAGASAAFFKATANDIAKVIPGDYNNPKETTIRKGLPYFFNKAKSGKSVRIAYIGGSITQANNQYRKQSLGFIQGMFPKTEIIGINAGVSGTDTDLGAARLYEQVLKHNPDMIFIEFAVNGGFPEGMEGMVRQIIKHSGTIDICFIYTVMSAQLTYYQQGTITPVIQKLEDIASHYNIPSVHMGMEAAELVKNGKLLDKGKVSVDTDIPVFSNDGVHPSETGGDLYASAIARAMLKMQNAGVLLPYQLPKPLLKNNWEDAKMVEPQKATFSQGWVKIDPAMEKPLKTYKSWFPYIMTSEKAGEEFKFKYKGKAFGLFDIGAPEVGQLDVYVDGKQVELEAIKSDKLYKLAKQGEQPLNRFNKFCNNRYRGQYFFVQTEDGVHEVVFKISAKLADKKAVLGASQQKDISQNPEKYDRSVIYIGKILLVGDLIP